MNNRNIQPGINHPTGASGVQTDETDAGDAVDVDAAGAGATAEPRSPNPMQSSHVPGGGCARGDGGGHSRWWIAVAVTTVLALPLAWVLSFAAALPFFIGVFFFLLAGLIVGAIAHRLARAGRPFHPAHLLAGTTAIVLSIWFVTVVKEARDFPDDMASQAEKVRDIGGLTLEEFRTAVASDVRKYVDERYPPGGVLGYVQWVVGDGVFERGELPGVERGLQAAQRGAVWLLRVALSVGLLAFGVGSQTFTLRLEREPAVRAIDA